MAPTYDLRMALALKDVQEVRRNMNIEKKQAINGKDGYYKPLEEFAKFGTSGIRWLVTGAQKLLASLPDRIAYYMSNKYKRTVGGQEVLAEDFNMPSVGAVAKSIALYNLLKAQGIYPTISGDLEDFKKRLFEKGLLVIYDSRPGNLEYATETARILAAYGIKVVLTYSKGKLSPTPLPAVSRLVKVGGYAGSITFTASHNGDEWNGIKFEGEDGGAASPKTTDAIGAILSEELALKDPEKPVEYDIARDSLDTLIKQGKVATFDTLGFYVKELLAYLNKDAIMKAIKEGRAEYIYSAFFGSSGPTMVRLFQELGLPTDNIIETVKAADQGYVPSYEPTLNKLVRLSERIEERGRAAGTTTVVIGGSADNDADRFHVNQYNRKTRKVEECTPEKLAAILAHYMYRYKGLKGPVGRSFVSGSLVDEVAKLFGFGTVETATGFKFSPKVFVENGGVLLTEESYGLALELVAVTGKSLDEYYEDLLEELMDFKLKNKEPFSEKFFKRYDQEGLSDSVKQEAIERFTEFFGGIRADKDGKVTNDISFAGKKITGWYNPKEYDGGMKFVLENGSWIALRSSGTEPIIRIYVEAQDENERKKLKDETLKLIGISDAGKFMPRTFDDATRDAIKVEMPEGYIPAADVVKRIPAIVKTMATQAGVTALWATEQFVDGPKTMLGWMNLGAWRRTPEIASMMQRMQAFANELQHHYSQTPFFSLCLSVSVVKIKFFS